MLYIRMHRSSSPTDNGLVGLSQNYIQNNIIRGQVEIHNYNY